MLRRVRNRRGCLQRRGWAITDARPDPRANLPDGHSRADAESEARPDLDPDSNSGTHTDTNSHSQSNVRVDADGDARIHPDVHPDTEPNPCRPCMGQGGRHGG